VCLALVILVLEITKQKTHSRYLYNNFDIFRNHSNTILHIYLESKITDKQHILLIISGPRKVVHLGNANTEETGVTINKGKNPSNVGNSSMKAGDNNNISVVETATTSKEMGEQIAGTSSGKPAPPPPGPPPLPPPRPPPLAPRPPPPPKGGHPPPAPPKPMAGKNQATPLGQLNQGSSDEGGDAPKPKLKPFFWDKVNAKPDQSMVWHEINAGSFV